jgi:hypothetical protein
LSEFIEDCEIGLGHAEGKAGVVLRVKNSRVTMECWLDAEDVHELSREMLAILAETQQAVAN